MTRAERRLDREARASQKRCPLWALRTLPHLLASLGCEGVLSQDPWCVSPYQPYQHTGSLRASVVSPIDFVVFGTRGPGRLKPLPLARPCSGEVQGVGKNPVPEAPALCVASLLEYFSFKKQHHWSERQVTWLTVETAGSPETGTGSCASAGALGFLPIKGPL